MVSQITSLTIKFSTVYSGTYQRKHERYASLAFVRGIHRWPANSPHKGPVTRKMFAFDDVIMVIHVHYSCNNWCRRLGIQLINLFLSFPGGNVLICTCAVSVMVCWTAAATGVAIFPAQNTISSEHTALRKYICNSRCRFRATQTMVLSNIKDTIAKYVHWRRKFMMTETRLRWLGSTLCR